MIIPIKKIALDKSKLKILHNHLICKMTYKLITHSWVELLNSIKNICFKIKLNYFYKYLKLLKFFFIIFKLYFLVFKYLMFKYSPWFIEMIIYWLYFLKLLNLIKLYSII